MGISDPSAEDVRKPFAHCALALAGLLAACAHVPPLIPIRDVLTPEEHLRLGSAYEAQGMSAEADLQYDAAVRLDPTCAEGWLALGDIAFAQSRFEEAEAFFRKALKASPHHAGASNNLAMVALARDGSLQEAEALARDALLNAGALEPYILDTLANIYLRERRYADAEAVIGRAEAATPPESRRVREQLLATRDSIKAAAAAR